MAEQAEQFEYDVLLSHSSQDKAVVRAVAERLRADGLRVWFDDWELGPGDSIPAKIEEGLEHSRVLVLCMSANAFGSEWAQLEAGTFRFRDPLNKERRFIPLRFDDAPIKGPLAQFLYINWLPEDREQEYSKLLEACRPPAMPVMEEAPGTTVQVAEKAIQLDYEARIFAYAFSPDGKRVLAGGADNTVRLWDVETRRCLRVLEGHTARVRTVVWSADQRCALSGAADKTMRLWDVRTAHCLRVLEGYSSVTYNVAWSADQRRALSGESDESVRLWDLETGRCLRTLKGHTNGVLSVMWSVDQRQALSAALDKTLRLWDVETGRCLGVLEGHTGWVFGVAWSPDMRRALSGSSDETVRLWDVGTGRCLRVFEGHTACVRAVAWNADQRRALSGSRDNTVRLWDVETGRCLRVLEGHTDQVRSVAWSADGRRAFSGDSRGGIRVWDLSQFVTEWRAPKAPVTAPPPAPDQVQYTNAKVLLVGESGAGKTGLAKRLALNDWQPSDSTVGAWVTHWPLPVASDDGVEREIWLWDFGGQADQRLIHQLYMDDVALAVLVFDGQKEDVFETLAQWDRDVTRASSQTFTKLLVAGRVDAGGLRVSREQIGAFVIEHGYAQFLETSAKMDIGCKELKQAIVDGIPWESIERRTSPRVFKQLKEAIVCLKDDGCALMRFNELRDSLRLRMAGEDERFSDEELKAVIGLLASPGAVWELKFGRWILLQPERINTYAQAVIQTLREDKFERGCIPEEKVLGGDLQYETTAQRLPEEEERIVLLAMHQTLVERGLCLREHTDCGPLLIFPSYYRRERPALVDHPTVLVTYRFNGFLDDIYATLVVKLHHTKSFEQDQLWLYAADFRTITGQKLGVKLTRRAEGAGELEVYFDPSISVGEKIVFSKYIHEHLLRTARDVVRLRNYFCPNCSTPVGNREVAMKRVSEGKKDIVCVNCEGRVPLWDELEDRFSSPEMQKQVRELQEASDFALDNESQERALVGEVISTVALAGQICRELSLSDHGIDMEIEFKDDAGQATGKKVYLQLKAGDSYLRKRQRDGAEVFRIKRERDARYWMEQRFPVILVIRTSDGEIRWMEIRDWLRRASKDVTTRVRQIVFQGARLDVMSVRRWREPMIQQSRESLTAEAAESLDANIRQSALGRLATAWADDTTRDFLFERCTSDSSEEVRCDALKMLTAMWRDDKTRDFLLSIAEKDRSVEVRSRSYEALSSGWWRELSVRQWVRSRISAESSDDARQRLISTIENAGNQVSDRWRAELSGQRSAEEMPETLPGYPAFRICQFRLRDIGPFHDTKPVDLRRDMNVLLGDNATGKTTILKCLALASIGPDAANEVDENAIAYLRKGADAGFIEVLFELIPDPEALPAEFAYFAVGLQITKGMTRFTASPDGRMSLRQPDEDNTLLPNSAEHLGALRTGRAAQFGFVSGYGATRTFSEGPPAKVNKPENEWVRSLFRPDAWLVTPGVFTQLIRGDTSGAGARSDSVLVADLADSVRKGIAQMLPNIETFFGDGDEDVRLNATNLRFQELSDGYRSLCALLGHLFRSSLGVRSWRSDPAKLDGIALIDEIDIHLHPAWQYDVMHDFCRALPNIQVIASTHSPLVVGALKRENVLLMRSEGAGCYTVDHPECDPQGLGVAGILTNIFDLSSTIDQPTLDKINRRLLLHSERDNWSDKEQEEYAELTDELAKLGFNREFSDPYFEQFAIAMAKRHKAALQRLTSQERRELSVYADKLLADLSKGDEQ